MGSPQGEACNEIPAQTACLGHAGEVLDTGALLVIRIDVEGFNKSLTALIDSGASHNFIRARTLSINPKLVNNVKRSGEKLNLRLADGQILKIDKEIIDLPVQFIEDQLDPQIIFEEQFLLFSKDLKYDMIFGIQWLAKHDPKIDWKAKTVQFQTVIPAINALVGNDSYIDSGLASNKPLSEDATLSVGIPDGKPFRIQAPDSEVESAKVQINLKHLKVFQEDRLDPREGRLDPRYDRLDPSSSHEIATHGREWDPCLDPNIGHETEGELEIPVPNQVNGCGNSNDNDDVDTTSWPEVELSTVAVDLLQLEELTYDEFLDDLKQDQIDEIRVISYEVPDVEPPAMRIIKDDYEVAHVELPAAQREKTKQERFDQQSWDALRGSPYYDLLWEYKDVFPDEVPMGLPSDKGVRHEIDLVPGTKYCVTRQWPLPRDQVEFIDKFFAERHAAGQVRESKSPHCSPTFCVKKATGGWRIVHAFNKINAATIPAQTPIPRKDVIINSMTGSTKYSTIDLRDGFYQILMRIQDIPYTAVSTPSGMLWEWLVMPQGLKNAPATFNRATAHLLRPLRAFAPHYFDDIFIHSKAEDGRSDVDVHRDHLRELLKVMRKHHLYASPKKCIFGADEIPILGCIVGRNGSCPDPEKVKAVQDWPVPGSVKDLRKFLGLVNYLHKYSKNFADLVRPLSNLLKKDVIWNWNKEHKESFDSLKKSLVEAPVLALPDDLKPYKVVCDASDFAIGCALMQDDPDGKERVVSYQSRQLKDAERNYPVHDKELLSMKYALTKFRVHLLGAPHFDVYTDHASLRTAVQSPHLSPRMARWLSFFSEYNFTVHYKPGKLNVLADALSRRPDYDFSTTPTKASSEAAPASAEAATASVDASFISQVSSSFNEELQEYYSKDDSCRQYIQYFTQNCDLPANLRSQLHRFTYHNRLLWYQVEPSEVPRIVIPNNRILKHRILFEYHNTRFSGHLGREKTYLGLSKDYWWPNMYKWVKEYIRTCESCQRNTISPTTQAPLQSLPIPIANWKSISMDFMFALPKDKRGNTGVVVFVDRLSKMVHIVAVKKTVTAEQTTKIFVDTIFKHHGMPEDLVSDRDPRFTSAFWKELFKLLGTELKMSTADHPETDGQTERSNRVILDMLRKSCSDNPESWTDLLPLIEFSINNSVHASTGYTPFYMNGLRDPVVPLTLGGRDLRPVGGGTCPSSRCLDDDGNRPSDTSPHPDQSSPQPSYTYGTTTGTRQSVSTGSSSGSTYDTTQGTKGSSSGSTLGPSFDTEVDIQLKNERSTQNKKKVKFNLPIRRSERIKNKEHPLTLLQDNGIPTVGIPRSEGNKEVLLKRTSEIINEDSESSFNNLKVQKEIGDLLNTFKSVMKQVRDRLAISQDKQKYFADKN